MMSPQEIAYFLECARTLNLSRAAERLGVSQPALTMALRRLEATVDTELFHRSKKGVRLTKAGEIFQQEAKSLADHWERLALSLRQSKEQMRGTYVLGCHASVALYSLPQTLPALLADFPGLQLDIRHDLSRKITEQAIRGEVDLAIVVNAVRHPDLVIKPLCKDQVGFWASKNETPTNRPGTEDAVLLCQPELNQTQQILRKGKVSFNRIVQSSSLEVIASLAEAGAGVAILPGRVASQRKQLKLLPDMPHFDDEISLLYRAENRRVMAFQELAKRLEKGML